MEIIFRFFAVVLMSIFANVAMAQTSKISLEPARITAEEVKAVEQVLSSHTPEELKLSLMEVELFAQLIRNGNQEISTSIKEDGIFSLPLGTDFSCYLLRENNGFSLLYEVAVDDVGTVKSCSEKLTIMPPHAELSASEVRCLENKLKISPEKLGLVPLDVQAFNGLLKHGNKGSFSAGYTEEDTLGSIPVHNGDYVEGYIVRIDDGVSLYYKIYDGQAERLKALRQTSKISLK